MLYNDKYRNALYSGDLWYSLPSNWAFDQVQEYTLGSSNGSFGVDKDVVSGRYTGFNSSGQPSNNENDAFFNELDELYNLAMSYTGGDIQRSNELTCQVLRYNSYNDPMWAATAGPIDDRFYSNARSILDTNALKYIYDYHEGTYLQTDHLAAVINAVIFNTTNFEYWIDSLDGVSNADSTVNDFAGWAGDLVTGADDMQKDIDMGVRSVQDAANYYIGNRANDGHCPFDDILQDVDGYNIGLSILNTGATLPSVMKTYYGINGLSYSRFTNFYINFTNLYTTGYSGTMQQNLYKRIMDCCISTDDSLIFHCRTALIMGIGEKNGGHIAQSGTLQAAGEAFYNLILNEMSKENG